MIDVDQLVMALPNYAKPFASAIADAAAAANVDPCLLFGLGDRETGWGTVFAYKQDAGDWAPRSWTEANIAAFPHVRRIGVDAHGRFLVMPEDGLGWGRGLMQLDFADQYDWLKSHDWRDPKQNVARGLEVLAQKKAFFSTRAISRPVSDGTSVTVNDWFAQTFRVSAGIYPDPRPLEGGVLEAAAIAAYNAAKENVLRMIVAGGIGRMDEVTTGKNYSADVRARAEALRVRMLGT